MYLGIDLGTGSVKAILVNQNGEVINLHSESYTVEALKQGWAETHPDQWWQATCKAVIACIANYKDIRAIGFSGQMHGTVLCDENMLPLRSAILWADTRAKTELEDFNRLSETQRLHLANPITTGMMATSLLWLKKHEATLYDKARWALQPKDWLRYQFTKEICTDSSDASATLLYDLVKDTWAFDVVQSLGLRTELLAPIKSSSHATPLCSETAELLNLANNLPVATGGGDAACSIYGAQLNSLGHAQINIGTAMQIFAISNSVNIAKQPCTHLYRTVEDNYYAMAAMQNAGIVFEWIRGIFKLSWDELYQEAFSVKSSQGLIFLPYLTGERTPHLNPYACGTWHGLDLKHQRSHMLRAVFEGIAFSLKDGLLALKATGIQIDSLRLAGGGSSRQLWQQLLADILEENLYEVDASSASAKGAARLAAKSVGDSIGQIPLLQLAARTQKSTELSNSFSRFQELYQSLNKTN